MSENPGDFAARAEQQRLNGDAHGAFQTAEAGLAATPHDLRGRVALALARIDLGDVLEARDELAAILGVAAPAATEAPELSGAVEDDELETAFAQAESNPDEMMDANRVVEQALRAAELDTPEPDWPDSDGADGDAGEKDFDLTSRPTYATESMAALLDGQGRRAEAEALRESLSARGRADGGDFEHAADGGFEMRQTSSWDDAALGPDHARRIQIVATLEGWLHNLRRNTESDPRRAGGRPRSVSSGAAGGAA